MIVQHWFIIVPNVIFFYIVSTVRIVELNVKSKQNNELEYLVKHYLIKFKI